MSEMISLQEVWEAAGGHPEIKATKEEVLLVLRLLDQCVDEQDEDIKKLDQEVDKLKEELKKAKELADYWCDRYTELMGKPTPIIEPY